MSYYKDIDELPLYNWLKISEGNVEYSRRKLSKGNEKDDIKNSEIIKDSYYNEFGVGESHIRLLDLQKELAEARLDWVITGDNFIKNRIAMLEIEIEEILDNADKEKGSVDETIISLSKWIGYRINVREVTVKEFYNMINVFKKEVEANKKKLGKNGTR